MSHPTAGLVVIGNEILSGKVTDANTPFLAKELRALGVDLRRVEVIPDEVAIIAEAVGRMSRDYSWVFTSGGVGPTHDDVTIDGVAAAFGRRVVRHPLLERLLREYYGDKTNEARLRMANVPEGADVLAGSGIAVPVVVVGNVHILPGIPALLQSIFTSVRDRFRASPYHCRRIYVKLSEADIVDDLEKVTSRYAQVSIGSYPRMEQDLPYRVMLTFDCQEPDAAQAACEALLELLPKESVHQVE